MRFSHLRHAACFGFPQHEHRIKYLCTFAAENEFIKLTIKKSTIKI